MLISDQHIHSNLNRVAKSIEDILRYHKLIFDTLNTLVTRKYRFSEKQLSHTTGPLVSSFNYI